MTSSDPCRAPDGAEPVLPVPPLAGDSTGSHAEASGRRQRDLAIEAYLDGSLSAADADRLVSLLRAGGHDATAIRERVGFAGLIGQALDTADATAVARAVLERLDATSDRGAFARRVQRLLPARQHRRRQHPSIMPLAAAALLVLATGAYWWLALDHKREQILICQVVAAAPGSVIERAGALLPARQAATLQAGDLVHASSPITLRYDDGTGLILSAGSRLGIDPSAPGKRVHLVAGAVEAEVTPQPAGRPFLLSTPQARVEVVGTHFLLAATNERTRLELQHGTVRLTRSLDGQTIAVQAGETADVAADTPFAARPQHAPAPATPPAESAGQPVFPTDGLEGWTQQHGSWSLVDGIVRSRSSDGPSRLISQRAFTDLILTCRLRILGTTHAEVQVGDYNWFFTIPANQQEWVDVRLEQRGGDLRCQADGVALQAEPGAGKPARPGPLAFYVMTGALEIGQARIQGAP
jgi:ferric-dicitrate binding protein FerR (iron transport regulator)